MKLESPALTIRPNGRVTINAPARDECLAGRRNVEVTIENGTMLLTFIQSPTDKSIKIHNMHQNGNGHGQLYFCIGKILPKKPKRARSVILQRISHCTFVANIATLFAL